MFLTPITELDAINEIVGSIGESPINTLENPTNSDVINAIRILSITNRSFQSNGALSHGLPLKSPPSDEAQTSTGSPVRA